MKRRTPLRRKTRLKPKRATARRSSRVRDREYLLWVKTKPCIASANMFEPRDCCGMIHAHHAGMRGLGQKSSDRDAVPLCEHHHRAWHDGTGTFKGCSKQTRGALARLWIMATRLIHEATQANADGMRL